MNTFFILALIIGATAVGDYFIKLASLRDQAAISLVFVFGAAFYAAPAVGWLALMRSHNLASLGVYYSAGTIISLTALGFFVFREPVTIRDAAGISLAILGILLMSR